MVWFSIKIFQALVWFSIYNDFIYTSNIMVRVELSQSLFVCFTTLYNIILSLIIGSAYISIALLYRLFRNGNLKFSVLFLNALFTFRDINILLQ